MDSDHRIDALLPREIALKAEAIGVQKTRLDFLSLVALAVLAGAFIGLGAMFATTVLAGVDGVLPFGVSRLLSGVVFCLGLILAFRSISLRQRQRSAGVALTIATNKVSLSFEHGLFLGILCNVLVCLAVWLAYSARTTADKIMAIVFPVSAFVVAGFEHSVANMYFIPLGLFIKAWAPAVMWTQIGATSANYAALTWAGLVDNLIPVTLGNIIGGGGLVGLVYWFVYLRKRAPAK